MMLPRRKDGPARVRHVHLGDRLLAIGRVRAGLATIDEVAAALGVPRDEVLDWIARHGSERTVTLDELRAQGSPEMLRLSRRAQRLADLVARAERDLRALNQELVRSLVASNEPFDPSNNLGENTQRGSGDVAGPQPALAHARNFVDGASRR
jgi:hypothetical protein